MTGSSGETLLAWIAGNRGGELESMIETARWYSHSQVTQDQQPAWKWVQEMAALGYVDVDWVRRKWVARRPVLTALPDTGPLLYATGAISHKRIEQLRSLPVLGVPARLVTRPREAVAPAERERDAGRRPEQQPHGVAVGHEAGEQAEAERQRRDQQRAGDRGQRGVGRGRAGQQAGS